MRGVSPQECDRSASQGRLYTDCPAAGVALLREREYRPSLQGGEPPVPSLQHLECLAGLETWLCKEHRPHLEPKLWAWLRRESFLAQTVGRATFRNPGALP